MKKIKDINNIISSAPICLFGSGSMGKYVFDRINKERKDLQIAFFIDDNKKGNFCGIPIINFNQYLENWSSYLILITSSYHLSIENKIKDFVSEYLVADFLSQELEKKYTEINYNSTILEFYTPNQFLYEVVQGLKSIEPDTIKWISSIKGGVFYDIGASCGIYSIIAGFNNQVVSVEPDALNFSLIKRNVFLNKNLLTLGVIPINMALGKTKELLSFNILEFGEGFHGKFTSNSERNYGNNVYKEKVLCSDLDSLINEFNLPTPTHIKIDVDGAEYQVLDGMQKTLINPTLKEILIESIAEQKFNVTAILSKFGFKYIESHEINEITGFKVEGVQNLLFRRI
jgi:FkbM family methyltransferase|tara:strand:- start:8679 stop:9707 length:1029 start_codon:yes stop_codon:yes gene_type:complete